MPFQKELSTASGSIKTDMKFCCTFIVELFAESYHQNNPKQFVDMPQSTTKCVQKGNF